MPLYCFQCKECGKKFERVLPMAQCMVTQYCECGSESMRDIVSEHASGTVDSQMREYTMEGSTGTRLYGASYLPHQIEEAKKNHPGREFKLVNGCYLPRIKHRRDKLQYLKEYRGGYVELD